MEDFQKVKVKRIAVIGSVTVGLLLVIIGFGSLSKTIVKNGYNPQDVVKDMQQEVKLIPENKPIEEMGIKTAKEATDLWGSVVAEDVVDSLIYKSAMLLTCEESPFKDRLSVVEYTSSKISVGCRIEWIFDDCIFGCTSTMSNGTPNVFTKSIPFTEVEREFLIGLTGIGNFKEDEVDGTYEIIYGV